MKRLTLEATDENILNSIKNNAYNRNEDVKDFVESLDAIEGNMFISLDARWGEGKTFYVREIEKTLEYITKKEWNDKKSKNFETIESYFESTVLEKVVLEKSYLPIYYNSFRENASFGVIGKKLGKDRTTIAKKIKRHSY